MKKIKPLLQNEMTECGYISFLMVLDYFGHQTDIEVLKNKFPISNEGSSFEDIISLSDVFGLEAEAYSVEQSEIDSIKTPAIMQAYGSHFVVIEKITNSTIYILDPAIGKQKISRTDFYRLVGYGQLCYFLEFNKTNKFQEVKERKTITILDFIKSIKGILPFYFQVFIFAILLQFVTIISPLYIQYSLDKVVKNHDIDLLNILIIGFAILYIIDIILKYFRESILIYMQSKIQPELSCQVFKRLLHLPLIFFQNRSSGNISNKFTALEKVTLGITKASSGILVDSFSAIVIFFVMLNLNVELTIIIVSIMSLYLVVKFISYQVNTKLLSRFWDIAGKERSIILDAIKNIQSIKLFTSEKEMKRKYFIESYKKSDTSRKLDMLRNVMISLEEGIMHLDTLVIVYIGSSMILKEEFTIGMLYSFIFYKNIFSHSFASSMNKIFEVIILRSEIQYLQDIFMAKEELYKSQTDYIFLPGKNKKEIFNGAISFDKFSFAYHELSENIFSNFNFILQENQSLCIVGASGSGKTTLLNSLVRLHQIPAGEIFISGIDISHIPINILRENISYMTSDSIFLDKSVIENISLQDTKPDIEKITNILKGLGLYTLITKEIFGGLEGYMGSIENRFSAGQKQRLLIARALYKDTGFLLLDEPTSSLDSETEMLVMEYIMSLKIRIIIVTHREAVAKYFNNILRLP